MNFFSFALLLFSMTLFAQEDKPLTRSEVEKLIDSKLAPEWYEKIQLRGYAQLRYNRLFETNNQLTCSSCDKSLGNKQNFFLRRARLVFFGEVSDRVYFYIQPDYSSQDSSGGQNYFQLRDAYFDYALTSEKEWRIRPGISKVPYGFQNLQSSSNRAPFDRDDALNTGVPNERDIGLFLMYSPPDFRKMFKELTSNNLKGAGDYGIFAFGAYNGQSLNKPEANNDLHRVIRFTYPFKLSSGQYMEASLQAYEGKFFVTGVNKDFYEQRTAATFVVYPQPFGFQAEYNVGIGPEYDPKTNQVETKNLSGGYAMVNYQFYHGNDRYFPYIRYQEYEGGRKLDPNATFNKMHEWEIGSEWQPNTAFELTVAYAISDRITQSSPTNRADEDGQLVRLQAQFNY